MKVGGGERAVSEVLNPSHPVLSTAVHMRREEAIVER